MYRKFNDNERYKAKCIFRAHSNRRQNNIMHPVGRLSDTGTGQNQFYKALITAHRLPN